MCEQFTNTKYYCVPFSLWFSLDINQRSLNQALLILAQCGEHLVSSYLKIHPGVGSITERTRIRDERTHGQTSRTKTMSPPVCGNLIKIKQLWYLSKEPGFIDKQINNKMLQHCCWQRYDSFHERSRTFMRKNGTIFLSTWHFSSGNHLLKLLNIKHGIIEQLDWHVLQLCYANGMLSHAFLQLHLTVIRIWSPKVHAVGYMES